MHLNPQNGIFHIVHCFQALNPNWALWVILKVDSATSYNLFSMHTVLSFLHQKKMIEHHEVEEDMHCEGKLK